MARRVVAVLVTIAFVSLGPAAAQRPLGSEFQVNTYSTYGQTAPAVALDADGDVVVVWQSDRQDGSEWGIFGQRYDGSGNALGGEFQVNSSTTFEQVEPAIATGPGGSFVVVWKSQHQGALFGVFGQRFDSAGNTLGGEFQANTYTATAQFWPDVAMTQEGDFVVVWASGGVQGQRFAASGEALGGEFQIHTSGVGYQTRPAIGADSGAGFVVVWTRVSVPGSDDDIYGRRFDASGEPLTDEFLVPTYIPGDQRSADVGMKPGGDFVVVWQSCCQDGSDLGIFGRRFDTSGGPIGGEFQINTYTTGRQSYPVVTLDGQGNFVVVWQSFGQDGSSEGLFAQEFSQDGLPVGEEFQVNTYTTDRQTGAAVSSAPDGDFVVAWRRGSLSIALSEVSAQRYAGPGLHLDAVGTCPGSVQLSIVNAVPSTEVAVIAAANTNGFVKGSLLCPGTLLEIGEPFQLPPSFVIVDEEGRAEVELTLGANRCFVEALALADCQTSGSVSVPRTLPTQPE